MKEKSNDQKNPKFIHIKNTINQKLSKDNKTLKDKKALKDLNIKETIKQKISNDQKNLEDLNV